MPTKTYKSLEKAYQALTDIEIEDDRHNFPVAKIKVPGLHTIKVKQLCEYYYYHILIPMREKILNYYINTFAKQENIADNNVLLDKIKLLINDITEAKTPKDIQDKNETLSMIFNEEEIRKDFFLNLKKMKIIKWWIGWKRYEMKMPPIGTLTIFIFLWHFNFDGVKKNVKFLLEKTIQDTNYLLPTISTNYNDWESWKERFMAAHKRFISNLKN